MKYIEPASKVDYAKKEEDIKRQIDFLQEQILIFNLLRKSLEKFEGKKITKRVIYSLKESGYTVSWQKDNWGTDIYIWNEDISYDRRLYFSINRTQMREFNMKEFLEKYSHFDTEKSWNRMTQYEKMLETLVENVVEYNLRVDEYNAALENLKKADEVFHVV